MSGVAHTWLERVAATYGERVALIDDDGALSFGRLGTVVGELAEELGRRDVRCLGLLADNGIPWVALDLAAAVAGVPLVPLPGFFTDQQLRSVIERAGIDRIATDDPARAAGLADGLASEAGLSGLRVLRRAASRALPPGAAKVTFTSGSTGHPKGVVLDQATQFGVAEVTAEATGCGVDDRHLCLHPLAILLENVAGVLRTLSAGGSVLVPSEARRGVSGSCGLNPRDVLTELRRTAATSAILVPTFLEELIARIERRPEERPTALRFVGVGGARTPAGVMERAVRLGLPVHEGYGLTEAGSVCTLNHPGGRLVGSVGTPLRGIELRIAPDGEVLVRGRRCLGYLDAPAPPVDEDGFWPTGDLGRVDATGRLLLEGRKRDVLCTGHGRNVAPTWIEDVLTDDPAITGARVFLAGSELIAVVRSPRGADAVAEAVRRANRSLPDYARVRHWRLENEPRLSGPNPSEDSPCSTTVC